MKESLFRKKNLERLSSPEDLNKYMRIASPAVWMAIVAVALAVIGAIVWGALGRVESTVPCAVVCQDGRSTVYISEQYIARAEAGQTVRLGENEYTLGMPAEEPCEAEEILSEYAMYVGGFTSGEYVYCAAMEGLSEPGSYAAEIVTESIRPLSFLWN